MNKKLKNSNKKKIVMSIRFLIEKRRIEIDPRIRIQNTVKTRLPVRITYP